MTEALLLILESRDQRRVLKKRMAQEGFPCVSLSLNVPGFPKSNPIVNSFFKLCLNDLKYHLKAHLVDLHHQKAIEICDAAGDLFFVPCTQGRKTLAALKQVCEDFENNHPLGRFVDVDLNDTQGNTVSSGRSKLCFYCHEKPAIECRRENTHDPEELRSFMFSKMAAHCRQQREDKIIRQLSSHALKALLYEISLTPKPGLVDKFSNGSHRDMNYQTFIDSTSAISAGFAELVRAGFNFSDSDLTQALPLIRNLGLRMESTMFEATSNVNTQKGIIFLMGLSLFACGHLFKENDQFDVEKFRAIVKGVCKELVSSELNSSSTTQKSHGENIFLKYGIPGARGEAESGFQTVFESGLPQLSNVDKLNDQALIKCFLSIASENMDTNILYRSDSKILSLFQQLCKTALEDFGQSKYSTVIDFCKEANISPGGSADLLAVTIFVWLVINQPLNSL